MAETPQEREDRFIERVLAIGAMVGANLTLFSLLHWAIPDKNEVVFGTVIGFVFGNMVGPVYRKVFGGADTASRAAQVAQTETLKSAVDKLGSSPTTDGATATLTIPADTAVEIKGSPTNG
jgi:xanthosine utilization system XapX-like protein